MLLQDSQITRDLVIKTLENKKYKVYTKPNQLNIIGIRSAEKNTGVFNDRLFTFYTDSKNNIIESLNKFTTKPGTYWLNNLLNKSGTAILVPDQYIDAYMIGTHQGKYTALVHRGKVPVKVYRDSNKDSKLDLNIKTIQEGYFGINIHRAGAFGITELIGKYSAGCQVFKNSKDFDKLIKIAQEVEKKQDSQGFFTYTLLDEIDLINVGGFKDLLPKPVESV